MASPGVIVLVEAPKLAFQMTTVETGHRIVLPWRLMRVVPVSSECRSYRRRKRTRL
jgi:hypothetical protein